MKRLLFKLFGRTTVTILESDLDKEYTDSDGCTLATAIKRELGVKGIVDMWGVSIEGKDYNITPKFNFKVLVGLRELAKQGKFKPTKIALRR
jgi:hypothetical protein